MVKKHYRLFWVFFLMIIAIAGCDSTKSVDSNNLQLTVAAAPTTVLTGEFSSITATLNNVDTSVATGTSITTTTPVSGYPVTFMIIQNVSKCSLTVINSLTDASGKAMPYISGLIAGMILSRSVLIPAKLRQHRLL